VAKSRVARDSSAKYPERQLNGYNLTMNRQRDGPRGFLEVTATAERCRLWNLSRGL